MSKNSKSLLKEVIYIAIIYKTPKNKCIHMYLDPHLWTFFAQSH